MPNRVNNMDEAPLFLRIALCRNALCSNKAVRSLESSPFIHETEARARSSLPSSITRRKRSEPTGEVKNANFEDMIKGIGTDIVLIARIRKLRPAAVTRLLTLKEREYCKRYANPHERIAGRFAAKEAILKAMGTGLSSGIAWHQIEVLPDSSGAPHATFSGAALRRIKIMGATRCHVSISHQGSYSVAFAVLEK